MRTANSVARVACAPLAACMLLAACGGSPSKQPAAAPPQSAAVEANRRAESYLRYGDLGNAARGYREALRISQSLEDPEGIAANAINLSIVYQRMGKNAEARDALAPVLDHAKLKFAPARLAQASLRMSLLDLDERRYASARDWADRADSYCARSCALVGAIQNVKGQLALETGNLDAARAAAKAALDASRSSGDRAEEANALRLLGITATRAGDPASALAQLNDALAIDRDLAIPRKIYLDLVGLGQASAQRGERDAARVYYERALAVSEADRDTKASAEAKALIEGLGGPITRGDSRP
jgi:tetratricopeptide (TPR) repeat protein